MADHFTGHDDRECGEHRTTGHRAWCFDDSEWCYAEIPCRGCELPALRRRVEEAEAKLQRLRDDLPKLEQAAQRIAATDSHAALHEFTACIRTALDQMEETDHV